MANWLKNILPISNPLRPIKSSIKKLWNLRDHKESRISIRSHKMGRQPTLTWNTKEKLIALMRLINMTLGFILDQPTKHCTIGQRRVKKKTKLRYSPEQTKYNDYTIKITFKAINTGNNS